jgi:hypothetical protein
MSGLLWMMFWLLIGFIHNLQVVTIINYNTVVGLHNLQTLHTNLFSSLHLQVSLELHTPNCQCLLSYHNYHT